MKIIAKLRYVDFQKNSHRLQFENDATDMIRDITIQSSYRF